jgi:hypothetical protein
VLTPARYKQLRWALAMKARSLGVKIPPGYRTTLPLPPGLPARKLIHDVQEAAKKKGLYKGGVDSTFNTLFQAYLVPPPAADVNKLAAQFMLANEGPKENLGPNSGTWLNAELDRMGEAYMHIGHAPWCAAIGGRAAYIHAGVDVHVLFPGMNVDYCPSWEGYTRAGTISVDHHWRLVQVALTQGALKYGDFLLYDWPGVSPGTSDHFGRFLNWHSASELSTIEGNTSSGESGSQSDGGGIYHRTRPLSTVRCAGRLVKLT